MLMFLFGDIPNTCHLLLGLLFLIAASWTVQTIKKIQGPGPKKKHKNHLTRCLTSLQESRDKGTDPGRSPEDLNLEYTLRTLDRNIQYLAWQMQRIARRTKLSSESNTSIETVVSVHSWTHLSAESQTRIPPSPVPAILERDVESGGQQQHLVRPPGAGLQQVRVEALSHRNVDFNIRQKQLKEQWGGPTPHSESLTQLIPSAPVLHPTAQRTDPCTKIRAHRILSYKEQELLNWHVQRKQQQKEAPLSHPAPVAARPLIDNDKTQTDGTVHWMIHHRSRSHTPLQSNTQGRHTPPRSPRAASPGPCVWPPVPFPPPEELPPPPVLVCKSESRSKVSGSVQVKVSSEIPKEELEEMLTMLAQSKTPIVRESERPGTPKEKEKDRHSLGRRPGSPKDDLSRGGQAGSPKDKQAEVKVSLRADKTIHTFSWTNIPDSQRKSVTQEPPAAAAQPKFLDPSFMCQNQLEFPCIAVLRGEQNQKIFTFAEPHPCPPTGTPKPQCLAHTILQSLDAEQATRDLQMQLAKGLETGHTEPSVEYPLCLLCGRCTPYCPHPRTRHSPNLLVYPRLDVRDGEAYMTLGFLLKIKRSDADEWGLTKGRDVLRIPPSKERPSKKEKSKHTTPRRKSHPRAAGPQEPKTPYKTPPVVRKLFPETGDRNIRSPVATPRASRVIPATPAPATPQTPKTPQRPKTPQTPKTPTRLSSQLAGSSPLRRAKPPVTSPKSPVTPRKSPVTPPKPPITPAKSPITPAKSPLTPPKSPITPARPPAMQPSPKTPEKPPTVMNQVVSCIKDFWTKIRQFCREKSSPSDKPGTPSSAPISPEPRKESGAFPLHSPASGARVKGDISNTKPSATPQESPKDRKGPFLRFKEQDSPSVLKEKSSSPKKSPKTPRTSPGMLRTPPK